MFAKRLRRLALTAAVCLCLAGCQAPSAGGQPAGASSASARPDEPVTLSVYLPKQYADPTTHYPIYEKLMDYQQAHPNIELTFVTPASNDLAEREAMISQLNAEILSGGGPDLFIMEGYRTQKSISSRILRKPW